MCSSYAIGHLSSREIVNYRYEKNLSVLARAMVTVELIFE